MSETVSHPQINHIVIVMAELAQAGVFLAVEGHIPGCDFPIIADFVFYKYLSFRKNYDAY